MPKKVCSNPFNDDNHQKKAGTSILIRPASSSFIKSAKKVLPNLEEGDMVCQRCRNEIERQLKGKVDFTKFIDKSKKICVNPLERPSHRGKDLRTVNPATVEEFSSICAIPEGSCLCVDCRFAIRKAAEEKKATKAKKNAETRTRKTTQTVKSSPKSADEDTLAHTSAQSSAFIQEKVLNYEKTLDDQRNSPIYPSLDTLAESSNISREPGSTKVIRKELFPELAEDSSDDAHETSDGNPTHEEPEGADDTEGNENLSESDNESLMGESSLVASDFCSSEVNLEKLNISLGGMEMTPITNRSRDTIKRKYTTVRDKLRESFKKVSKEQFALSPKQTAWTCENCTTLVRELAEKFAKTEDRNLQYLILTSTPKDLSINEMMRIFNCSERMAKNARKLRKEVGAFSAPHKKTGRANVSAETKELIRSFYLDDGNSRQMPGLRDTIWIKNEEGKQRVAKKRMLITLKELYDQYILTHPSNKVSISTFCILKPKQCVWMGTKGFYNQCTCVIHENFKLLMQACELEDGLSQVLTQCVCDETSSACMMGVCALCPKQEELDKLFVNLQGVEKVDFHCWVSTDHTEMVQLTLSLDDFRQRVLDYIPKILAHHFLVRKQRSYKEGLKDFLKENPSYCAVTVDFAQNYSFVVQDAVQGYHWNRKQATVHPFYVEYFDPETMSLAHKTYVTISNELNHVTKTFYAFQAKFVEKLKQDFPHFDHIIYFSDGSAAQYKNFKNFLNVMYHYTDFGIHAQWEFFPTAHGKGPSDAASAVVKTTTRLASLRRRPEDPKILTPWDMFEFCSKALSSDTMQFMFVSIEDVKKYEAKLTERYKCTKSIPGSREVHSFRPISLCIAHLRRFSLQEDFRIHDFSKTKKIFQYPKLNSYCAAVLDGELQFGLVSTVDTIQQEIEVKFFTKATRGGILRYPDQPAKHWLSMEYFICNIEEPRPATKTARNFLLSRGDLQKARGIYSTVQQKSK